jgi:hypothetical protein
MRERGSERATTGLEIRAQTRAARHERGVAAQAARHVQWRRWGVLLIVWQAVSWAGASVLTWLVGFTALKFGFFVVVVSVACLPLFARVLARPGWLLERQVRAGVDVALAVGHLPPRLGRLAEETRVLRLAIEAAPEDRAVDDWVWAWVAAVRELAGPEREVLAQLGLSAREVEAVLVGEPPATAGAAVEAADLRSVRASPDPRAQRRRVELLAEHLEAFELALLRHDPDPYR